MEKPVVTVNVSAYNSSKYVLETLESIKAQTYPNLILQISDDCSTDNTLEICKNWIDKNKDRFVETRILTIDHNTGVSANANRAWDACTTEYLKTIAGDDLLLPSCIEDNMAYVNEHPGAVVVFSRVKTFGVSQERCERYEKIAFDYYFFQMASQQQYERIKNGSCIPAASAFYNIKKIRELGVRHDERIPLREDRPKWITFIRKGVKFHFFDKATVMYRLHGTSLSNTPILTPKYYESGRLIFYYYVFQDMYHQDQESAIREAVRLEMEQYLKLINCIHDRNKYYRFSIYRLISALKSVVKYVKNLFHH